MASLAIRKLKYIGTRYEYESPELGDGLVILEGSNGSGKSTFANLIYFGLGGRVDEFRSDSTEKHVEIVGDEGNYVELRIAIDQSEFLLKRFIGQNDIAVSNGESVELLPLTRGEGREFIFSDWMLKQLDIEPVLLQFATYSGKISFTDLCRLIYHDQAPDPSGIFRAVDNNSFVSDSRVFRRAIFELLIGKRYQSYYSTLAQFRLADQERNKANHALELFSEMSDGLVISDSDTTERTQAELKDLRGQATRLLQYRGELAKAPPPQDSESDLAITQQKYVEAELELAQIARAEAFLLDEAADIERLKADLIVEATQIKKMMFANEKLALFDADTCPYCLHPVQRVEGQCICGREVQGGEFVKFFYNEQEYATILKSKQKNVETLKNAAESILAELKETRLQKQSLQGEVKSLQAAIREIVTSSATAVDVREFERVESKLNEVRDRIRSLESVQKLVERQTTLEQRLADCIERASTLRRQTEDLEGAAEQDMESQRVAFSKIYGEMMRATVSGCRTASIDLDYMPILNEGEYKQASAAVPRRLLYFASLLDLSLTNAEIRFPRFLLIDTPDTAGIDDNNLEATVQQLSNVVYGEFGRRVRRQVILTTGVGKYPQLLAANVFAKLRDIDGQRLLKLRPAGLP